MKRTGFFLSLALIFLMLAGNVFAGGGQQAPAPAQPQGGTAAPAAAPASGTLPRNETLYIAGLLWDPVASWNPYGSGTVSFGMTPNEGMARELIYETLFMYNMLDAKMYPLLADKYEWQGQTCIVTLDKNVYWNDGQPFTAADVVNSFDLHKRYQTMYSANWTYVESVTATDNYTVVVKGNPANFNPKQIEHTLASLYITPKHVWDKITAEVGPDRMALGKYLNPTPVSSGPYKPFSAFGDQAKVILIRDDNYWGAKSPKFGKLPAPKYIAHNIYKDNASGDAAFRSGEVDITQQYTASIWTFPETVETYIPQAPYYFPGTIPFLVFNTKRPGLDDAVVRRAIAMAIDYTTIGQNAMSGYTAKLIPSLMLPTPAEHDLVDAAALKPYQWSDDLATAVAAANKLLDDAGWVKGADGIRAKNGVKLSYQAECPSGWSDWNASLEVVAQAGQQIGMDIKTYFPTAAVAGTDTNTGNFDIIMTNYARAGPASPWLRAYQAMGSADLPPEGTPNQIQNWGRWVNAEANDIIAKLQVETNLAVMKQLWTRLNIIYLQEMPCAGLMYRPTRFHSTNSVVWTNYPKINDGTNIPPMLNMDGYAIKGLYTMRLK